MMPSRPLKRKPKSNPEATRQWQFDAIGTLWDISFTDDLDNLAAERLRDSVMDRIEVFDQSYSRFRADSLVASLAKRPGRYTFPADAKALFDIYRQLYDLSAGRMTPLIGQSLSDAGYDANYSFLPQPLTPPPAWSAVMEYRQPDLTTSQQLLLDFGAAGKGYLVDSISQILLEAGVNEFCIDAGGDMCQYSVSQQSITVALEHPADPTLAIGTIGLSNLSLCGSAGNRRAWGSGQFHYNHIIDPVSLKSPLHVQAVWVLAAQTIVADALTTALYFVQPEVLAQCFDFEYAMVLPDNSLAYSPGFAADFYA